MNDISWLLQTRCKRLFLENFCVDGKIGAYDFERVRSQPILFNCDVWILHQDSTSKGDSLGDVFDYTLISQTITNVTLARHHDLQETLLEEICFQLLKHPQIVMLRISSSKPMALDNAKAVGVELWRPGKSFTRLLQTTTDSNVRP